MISVLGSGVAGLCAATSLHEAGFDVQVIAPPDAPVAASSYAGGMLAPFCEGESAPQVIVQRGQLAVHWWSQRVRGVETRGTLVLAAARDQSELTRFSRATQAHDSVIPGDLEPDLQGRFARGLFFRAEAHMDPRDAMAQLRSQLIANGVPFHNDGATGQIVDCRGLAARDQLHDLRPVRGEMLEVIAPDVTLTRTIRLLHPRFPCYIVPRAKGRYMIGATMVESGDARGITARAIMELLSAAYTVHPGFAEAEVIATGAGLRPAFPDNIPALRHDGDRIHLNGLYRHGFLMAPSLADDLVQLLQKGPAYAH
ncbi:thiamine biosynthesis protein thio [Thioclava sp. SK-1]|uniref:FAD-dependent oxidoreductase n=1 Tax=Thioclava sp. SK-1 TaxID=1889770 RepID=UPI000824FD25|nr:FAD-dependent oxidoreductase [Thioclava sp. SK-1]OCX61180.1 thiamine biosynthesis protein thio [Thioclava sp. SK-1]